MPILMSLVCLPTLLAGQPTYFAGGLGGISTLSADGQSSITSTSIDASLYKPENGATFQIVGGCHLNDYLSIQVNYGWNLNSLTLTSSQPSAGENVFYQQMRSATQHSVLGELMLYFRDLKSRARPYLSVGTGVVRLVSNEESVEQTLGDPTLAPMEFNSTNPALRIAVGIDLAVKNGWAFRFTFSETLQSNTISANLDPPGQRNLAHFQNLFGFVKYF
ncbi:MAG: outer membrane beta-barrel protein [Acidobacteriota bacterium]